MKKLSEKIGEMEVGDEVMVTVRLPAVIHQFLENGEIEVELKGGVGMIVRVPLASVEGKG